MKKPFIILATLACVALVGLTVSCNKEDSTVINNSNWDGVSVPVWESPTKKIKQINYTYRGLPLVHRFTWNGDNLTHFEAELNGLFTSTADFTYENGKVSTIKLEQIDSPEITSRFAWDGNRVVSETIEAENEQMAIEYTYRNGQLSNIKSDGMTTNLTWNSGNLMSMEVDDGVQYYTYDSGKNPLHVFMGFFMMQAFEYVNIFSVNTLHTAPSLDIISYTYDADGFPITMSWSDDGSGHNDTITMTFTYYE